MEKENGIALVTGAARGIGLAIAQSLVERGYVTYATDIDEAELEEINAKNPSLNVLQMDILDPESIRRAFEVVETRGKLSVLVNNAAIPDETSLDDLTLERIRYVMAADFEATMDVTLQALHVFGSSGSIVNVASIMGAFGTRGAISYSSAKAAIMNMTRCLACDVAQRGITVNAIAPGFIDTRMGRPFYVTEEFQEVYIKHRKIPLGRAGNPAEVAGAVSFLVGPEARYITGQTLFVDGGVSATF